MPKCPLPLVIASVVLLNLGLLCPFTAQAQLEEGIDSKHIFSNANLAIVFQIGKLEEQLTDANKVRLAKTHEWLKSVVNLPTETCNELIFQFGADEYGTGYRGFQSVGFVFRTVDAIPDSIRTRFKDKFGFEEHEHKGQSYIKGVTDPLFVFSGNSLLLAEEERAFELIDNEIDSKDQRQAPIAAHLPGEAQIAVHLDFENESFNTFCAELFAEPGTYQKNTIKSILDNASSANLIVDTDSMTPITLTVEVKKGGDIEKLEMALTRFIDETRSFAKLLDVELNRGTPNQEVAFGAKAFTTSLIKLVADPDLVASDDSVVVTIADSDSAVDSLNHFVHMMTAAAEFFEENGMMGGPGEVVEGRAERAMDKK